MKPTAEVIGLTRFIGVPKHLLPLDSRDLPDYYSIKEKFQDQGSEPARLIECAGRTCYDSYGKGRSSQDYHKHILEVGHGSVLEHSSISFYLTMSRGCSHEWVRHRAGCAISQRSTRYVDESTSMWDFHPLLQQMLDDPAAHGARVDSTVDIYGYVNKGRGLYKEVVNSIEAFLTSKGMDKLTARKQARGAARGLLGNALRTEMVWTANIRALRNVMEQRCSRFADAEIRLLGNAVYEAAYSYIPEYLDDYEKVNCPDGIGFELTSSYRKV